MSSEIKKSVYICDNCNMVWFVNEYKEFCDCPWCDDKTKVDEVVKEL